MSTGGSATPLWKTSFLEVKLPALAPSVSLNYEMPSSLAPYFHFVKLATTALTPADWRSEVYAGRLTPLGERVSMFQLPRLDREEQQP